ncbi:dihydrofolate reductase family protein [Spirillospora sp. NPDC050679]
MDMGEMVKAYAYPDTAPWLRANMIATLDGGIQYKGNTSAIGYEADWQLMQQLRGLADVVVMGATTIREYDEFPSPTPLAIVSRSLDLDFDGPVFTKAQRKPIVITCEAAPPERLRVAQERAEVMICGTASADVGQALAELAARGFQRMLCEGGPVLLAEVAAAGWLHELCLTLSPMVTAGDAARILNGPVMDVQRMKLCHAIQDGDYLYLKYQVQQ